jgi:GT2 family glycosyltransferase
MAIVLNHNGWKDAVECVTSLLNSSYRNLKCVLVDNGSTDNSVAELTALAYKNGITLLRSVTNLGIAGGNNLGIRYALEQQVDYVLLVSNDVIVDPDCVERLVMVAQSDQRVAAVGPKVLYYSEPGIIWFAGAKINVWLARAPHIGANRPDRHLSGIHDVDLLMGCAILVRRQVFEELGLFDERYFFQNEDLEFSYRIKRAGWKIKVDMDARVYHKVGRTIGTESPERWYYATRNRLLFIDENLPPVPRLTAKVFFSLTRLPKFFAWLIGGRRDLIRASVEGWRDYRIRRLGARRSFGTHEHRA